MFPGSLEARDATYPPIIMYLESNGDTPESVGACVAEIRHFIETKVRVSLERSVVGTRDRDRRVQRP